MNSWYYRKKLGQFIQIDGRDYGRADTQTYGATLIVFELKFRDEICICRCIIRLYGFSNQPDILFTVSDQKYFPQNSIFNIICFSEFSSFA